MSDETTLLPCPICGKKVYIGLYGGEPDYWWMVHGGMHYDECKCRLFMESCKFELEDETRVDYDERAMNIRGGLVRRWNARAAHGTLTAEQVRDTVEKHWHDSSAEYDWQAITDELNAELGSDDEYEAKMDKLLCYLTNGKFSKSRQYSLDFMKACVDEEYEDAYNELNAALGSGTCHMSFIDEYETASGEEEYLCECSECGYRRWEPAHDLPLFCSKCGKKVER